MNSWEQRKLEDICSYQSSSLTINDIDENGQYDLYDANSLIGKTNKGYMKMEYITIIKDGAGVGRTRMLPKNSMFLGTMGALTPKNSCLGFLYQLVTNANLGKICTGSTIPHIYFKDYGKLKFYIPSIIEQEEIGKFFHNIDYLITLHQRKLDNLKLKKKALLQKLFPKNGNRYPELRFPGFTDAWEQRKLGQFTARVTRKNAGQSDLPLTISAQDGLVDQRKYFNRQVASRDMSNYYLIKKGEFAYNKSYSEGYPFGAVKRLDYYDIGALSTLYILFEITDKNISSDFIVSYYMTHLWYKEISKRAAEGARNHGLLNISTEDFFDSELNIPNSIEEQVKIGNFIKQFDKFITLHQRKLDHLKLQKKALLQQMFV